jgi:hypothetical protein
LACSEEVFHKLRLAVAIRVSRVVTVAPVKTRGPMRVPAIATSCGEHTRGFGGAE